MSLAAQLQATFKYHSLTEDIDRKDLFGVEIFYSELWRQFRLAQPFCRFRFFLSPDAFFVFLEPLKKKKEFIHT